jgi:GNAT superfamily N-acetyltransferase
MNWYNKLNDYFPQQEMKKEEHIRDLIQDQEAYHKEETKDYIVLYAEYPDFIFIDYFLVTSQERGKGLGSRILDQFKAKNKIILLEVEPPDIEDVDTERRLAFYKRNGFRIANHIEYEREDEKGESFFMDILYWPAGEVSQKVIMDRMAKACRTIHNFRAKAHYGREIANPEEVLRWTE